MYSSHESRDREVEEMSKAKEEYYKFKAECDRYHEGLIPDIDAYVSELEEELSRYKLQAIVDRETINSVNDKNKMLEAENARLIKDITNIGIENIKLRKEKAELIEFINKQANEYDDSLSIEFLKHHKQYIIQNEE